MTLLFFGAGGEYANIRTGNHGTYSVALPRDTYHVYALAPCPIPGCWPARWRVAESPVAVLGGETIRQTLTIIDPTMKGALNG
jgi:hypothetical protein